MLKTWFSSGIWSVVGLCAIGMAGCASLPETSTIDAEREQARQAHTRAVSGLMRWSAFGRISLRRGQDAWYARLDWRQRDTGYRIRLIAPFGQGTLQIQGDHQLVTLRDNQNHVHTAGSPERLMLERMGWRVPVTDLRDWMVGRPGSLATAEGSRHDAEGRLSYLRQAGWEIEFRDYRRQLSGVALPGRLELRRDTLAVTIIVSRWEFDNP